MKKITMAVLALCIVFTAGCTTYAGISQADKPGSYYIVTNSQGAFGPTPGVELCKADKSGNLKCKSVDVD